MAINFLLIVHAIQAALSVLVLGLMSYVASWWTTHWRQFSPHEINFLIFTSIWSLLSTTLLILPHMSHLLPARASLITSHSIVKIGLVGLECLTMLYWFGGFVALAVFLNDRICFGTVCAVAKAGVAGSACAWAVWCGTCGYSVWKGVAEWKSGRLGAKGEEGKEGVGMHQGV